VPVVVVVVVVVAVFLAFDPPAPSTVSVAVAGSDAVVVGLAKIFLALSAIGGTSLALVYASFLGFMPRVFASAVGSTRAITATERMILVFI
jgi:hypothetical protein